MRTAARIPTHQGAKKTDYIVIACLSLNSPHFHICFHLNTISMTGDNNQLAPVAGMELALRNVASSMITTMEIPLNKITEAVVGAKRNPEYGTRAYHLGTTISAFLASIKREERVNRVDPKYFIEAFDLLVITDKIFLDIVDSLVLIKDDGSPTRHAPEEIMVPSVGEPTVVQLTNRLYVTLYNDTKRWLDLYGKLEHFGRTRELSDQVPDVRARFTGIRSDHTSYIAMDHNWLLFINMRSSVIHVAPSSLYHNLLGIMMFRGQMHLTVDVGAMPHSDHAALQNLFEWQHYWITKFGSKGHTLADSVFPLVAAHRLCHDYPSSEYQNQYEQKWNDVASMIATLAMYQSEVESSLTFSRAKLETFPFSSEFLTKGAYISAVGSAGRSITWR
jgi:hypothetical protein